MGWRRWTKPWKMLCFSRSMLTIVRILLWSTRLMLCPPSSSSRTNQKLPISLEQMLKSSKKLLHPTSKPIVHQPDFKLHELFLLIRIQRLYFNSRQCNSSFFAKESGFNFENAYAILSILVICANMDLFHFFTINILHCDSKLLNKYI